MVDSEGNNVFTGLTSDNGTAFTFMMNDNATTSISVDVTKAAGSANLVISNPAQATAAGAYKIIYNKAE